MQIPLDFAIKMGWRVSVLGWWNEFPKRMPLTGFSSARSRL